MTKMNDLEAKVKSVLRPVFMISRYEEAIDSFAQRIVQKAEFVATLNDSYDPMDKLVPKLYWQIENDIGSIRGNLLINPDGVRLILKKESAENDRYEILQKVVEALLKKEVEDYHSKHCLDHKHYPSNLIASFSSSRKVVDEGGIDIGVAIGPEGFAYASLFTLLQLPIKKILIDEHCKTEDRPYSELDDISGIKDKHVLLIDDDVMTGKTLEKAYSKIKIYSPLSVSVYLGSPMMWQSLKMIPKYFRKVFLTQNYLPENEVRVEIDKALGILSRKYQIFKSQSTSA